MIRLMRWGLVALGVLVLAPTACAHALLNRSDPEAGTTLERAPQAITLTFTEAPEPSLSSVRILLPTGQPVAQGPVRAAPGQPRSLRVALGPLAAGVYTVTWRTVSKIDGHVTGGAFAFGVGASPADATIPEVKSPPPSVLGGAARWALYAGLAVLLGASWVWTTAFPAIPATALRWLWLACLTALLGVLALGESQRAEAAAPLGQFLGTSLGRAVGWRLLPLLGAAAALGLPGGPDRRQRRRLWAVGILAAGSVLAHVAAGHAAAGAGPWRWANIAAQWVHLLSVGAWVGGLAALLFALGMTPNGEKPAAVRRFSTGAGILLVVVAATGTIRAIDEVGAWDRLVTTAYGRLIVLKVGLLVLLAILGGINRFRSVPAAIRSLTSLRRVGGAELGVAAVTLAVAATLTQTAPANFIGAPTEAQAPLLATGSDFATTVRVRVEVTPGYPGANRFVVSIRDYDSRQPIVADRVSLRFTSRDRPDVGASTLVLARSPGGNYGGRGSNLSLEGRWTIAVVIERGANSVEVPLTLAVRAEPQRVRTIEAPGQPTLYSITLSKGRVLDAYLDPGRAGFNEVHATYIDAAGHEMPIARPATMTVNRPGMPPTPLPVRRFGPGHFIGDAHLAGGAWQVTYSVTTSDGEVLRAHLTVRL